MNDKKNKKKNKITCECQPGLVRIKKECGVCGENEEYNPKKKKCNCVKEAKKYQGKCIVCPFNQKFSRKDGECVCRKNE